MDRMPLPATLHPGFRPLALLLLLGLVSLAFAGCSGGSNPEGATPTAAGGIATATSIPETTPTSALSPSPTEAPASPTAQSPATEPTQKPELVYSGYQIYGDFKTADAIDFPENLMTVIETGCIQCDGPTDALYRVWRNSGDTHVEKLIDAGYSGSDDSRITSFALRPDLSQIVVTICTECESKALANSPVTLYESRNGGVTWQVLTTTDPGDAIFVEAVTEQGIIVDTLGGGKLRYFNGDAITPPAGAEYLIYDSHSSGALHWALDGGSTVLDGQGDKIAQVEPGSRVTAIATGDASDPPVTWEEGDSNPARNFVGWNITTVGPDGKLAGFRSDAFALALERLRSGALIGDMTDGPGSTAQTIGFIDLAKGVLTPIHGPLLDPPFGNGDRPLGRNSLAGAVEGPFLRVTTGTPCVSVRVGTDVQAQELTCAVDGTLVYDLHVDVTVGAQRWLRVRLLDGREGFADARYLTAE